MDKFICDCGNRLYFENMACLACGRDVGWCPHCDTMTAHQRTDDHTRSACTRCGETIISCANRRHHHVCNRALPDDDTVLDAENALCDCCRYNDTIPDLTIDGNLERWRDLEQAKRRLIYGLDHLGLPHGASADGLDPGLSFDFKGDAVPENGIWRNVGAKDDQVFTGHANGKVTINIREADPAERERLRVHLGESHRTLIGHFRHEIGHYYYDLLVADNAERYARFVSLFGDPNNPDYQTALETHYRDGPPADWLAQGYVSAYATMHPWEDWAESFSLYLDMVDVLETAEASNLVRLPDQTLDSLAEAYVRLGLVVNELNRSIGLADFLAAPVAGPVVEKLRMIHDVVADASSADTAAEHSQMRVPAVSSA